MVKNTIHLFANSLEIEYV